jgi:phosphatidate cytidylyltransferase
LAASELGKRVAVALVGIPMVLGALYAGGWVLGALVAGAAVLAAIEFYRLAEVRGVRPFSMLGATAAGALVLLATARPTPDGFGPTFLAVTIAVTLLSLGGAVWLRWPGGDPLSAVSITVAGVLYTGGALAFVPLLRALTSSVPGAAGGPVAAMGFVFLPLLTTWAGDTSAYFAGRAWGRAKLAPAVSPGKTIVGAVAGLTGSTAVAVLLSALALGELEVLGVGLLTAAWIGLLLGAAGQVGDLAESMLKREAGVKDSGKVLPGHGGMLDRIDSLLFSVPAAWGLLALAGVIP